MLSSAAVSNNQGPNRSTRRRVPLPAGPHRALLVGLTLLVLCGSSAAQQQDQPDALPDAPSAIQPAQAKPQSNSAMQSSAQFVILLERGSHMFPNLATSTAPLSPEEKFKLAVDNSTSISAFLAANLSAGVNQAHDTPSGYGAGTKGYWERLGAAMARRSSSQVLGTFLLASAFHEDPRFYVRNDLNLGGSIKYAIRRVFVTRTDAGDPTFNWSGLLGMAGSEGLANVYYPHNYRSAANTFSRFGFDMLGNSAGNLLRQYWPRINRKLKTEPPSATPAASSNAAKR